MSYTYTKLFSSITASTVWCESSDIRVVWITMLAMADKFGRVFGSIPGLAGIARVPVDKCREAVCKFLSPDVDSRTPANEGRRIKEIDGGWELLNYTDYRERMDEDQRRIYKREWDRNNRPTRHPTNPTVSDTNRHQPTQAYAYAEAEALKKKKQTRPKIGLAAPPDFLLFWSVYPKKVGRGAAVKAWKKLNGNAPPVAQIVKAVTEQKAAEQWQTEGGRFIPNPATWLNQERWADEPIAAVAGESSVLDEVRRINAELGHVAK